MVRLLHFAHNGNLSNGWMFPMVDTYAGGKVDKNYVELRAKWEPLYEVTQIKGDGEAHPFLSPTDEFADLRDPGQGQSRPHRTQEARTCCSGNTRARR